jgi:hypothetical protein
MLVAPAEYSLCIVDAENRLISTGGGQRCASWEWKYKGLHTVSPLHHSKFTLKSSTHHSQPIVSCPLPFFLSAWNIVSASSSDYSQSHSPRRFIPQFVPFNSFILPRLDHYSASSAPARTTIYKCSGIATISQSKITTPQSLLG